MAKRKKQERKAPIVHEIGYRILRFLAKLVIKVRFNYRLQIEKPKNKPFLLMVNHNTDWDPIFVACAFKDPMYFVASEHITRWGWISKFLMWFGKPIVRSKATTESQTAKSILKTLRGGANVCIFAEGNRSLNGETCHILPSTAKLAKRCGATLVTYRMYGGYFSSPRWAADIRKGKMGGDIVGEYAPEQLAQMTDDEVYDLITRDLYADAYAYQRDHMVPFKGKNLAESIEIGLYTCPKCKRIGTIWSKGDQFGCDCGLALRYNKYGFFESETDEPPIFDNALDWDRWQAKELAANFERHPEDKPMMVDDGQRVYQVAFQTGSELVCHGKIEMYRDRLEFPDATSTMVMPFDTISNIDLVGRSDLTFSTVKGDRYEVKSEQPRSAQKYVALFRLAKDKTN